MTHIPTAGQVELKRRLGNAKRTLGYTDQKMAELLGITREAMVRRRLGTANVKQREMAPLAEILGMNVTQLDNLLRTGHPDVIPPAAQGSSGSGNVTVGVEVHHCTEECIGTHG